MSRRALLFFFAAVPLSWAAACSAPFTAIDADTLNLAAGAPSRSDAESGGALGDSGALALLEQDGGSSAMGGESADATTGAGGALASADGGMSGEGGTATTSGSCPKLGGERLVLADGFCVDENEVTVAHYQTFLDAHPNVADQPAACVGNTTFTGCKAANNPENEPQRCVDWCDARAYCVSVGKHLCGGSGGEKNAMPFDAPANAPENQWYAACSHGGEVAYPYGDNYDKTACWGADLAPTATLTVKSAPGCVGGYPGLWDMSGSLAEWVDSCNAEKGGTDACHIRGGSFSGTAEQLRCDWQSAAVRVTTSNYIGFRCCADVAP